MPGELRHPMKGLINIQNDDNKCFMWCHVRYLKLVDKNQQRIRKEDREAFKKLNYQGVGFPVSKKDYGKIEILNKINVNVFCYENKMVYPVYLSDPKFDDCMNLLLISCNFTSHYVYINILKSLTDLCLIKRHTKVKNTFVKVVYSVILVKKG